MSAKLICMDSLGDLLGQYKLEEPDEISKVKDYILKEFGMPAKVSLQGEALLITVGSASLANTLRLRTTAIQGAAQTTRRLIFRIG